METIKILKISYIHLDGGSIDEIITNIGTFKLINKIGNIDNKNGFYNESGKVSDELQHNLKLALDGFKLGKEIRGIIDFKNPQ